VGIKPHMWLILNPQRGGKMLKLVALYVLIGINFDTFVLIIENLKTPLSHVSTMAQYIKRIFFGALKSHDYHVLM